MPHQTPWFFSEPQLGSDFVHMTCIAPIEMHAIFRALQLFGPKLQGKAVLFFVDNTHAIGCLLKGSASVSESRKRSADDCAIEYSHYQKFLALSPPLRRLMNAQARAIWRLIAKFDVLPWFEYVTSACNIADPPSRGKPVPLPGARNIVSFVPHETATQ